MEKTKPEEVKVLILTYILKEFLEDEETKITFDTPLISSGLIDSFSMVSLLVFIERKFGIKIPPNKATPEAFESVNNIVSLINQFVK